SRPARPDRRSGRVAPARRAARRCPSPPRRPLRAPPLRRDWRPLRPRFLGASRVGLPRSEEHTSELQSRFDLVCRLLLEKKQQFALLNGLIVANHSAALPDVYLLVHLLPHALIQKPLSPDRLPIHGDRIPMSRRLLERPA